MERAADGVLVLVLSNRRNGLCRTNGRVDGSGGFVLPEAALASGCVFRIRNGSSGSINVTALAGGITGSTYGSYTNTGSSLTLNNGQYAELWSNGSTWVLK